jgi:hypothetical protein
MDSHIVKLISNIPTLSAETWEVWSWEVESALNLGGQWDTVLAKDPTSKQRPIRPLPQKADAPTAGELEKQTTYDTANRQAAGLIRHAAGITHREITQAANATAATMFDALEALYAKKSGGARFDAWTVLLAIQKLETETFPDLVKRIDAAAFRLDSLRPTGWTLAKEINEIKTFVMLNAIPQTHLLYGSLMAQPDNLTYNNVKAAFLMYRSPTTWHLRSRIICRCSSNMPILQKFWPHRRSLQQYALLPAHIPGGASETGSPGQHEPRLPRPWQPRGSGRILKHSSSSGQCRPSRSSSRA